MVDVAARGARYVTYDVARGPPCILRSAPSRYNAVIRRRLIRASFSLPNGFQRRTIVAPSTRTERIAQHWRTLGLIPGAPECVIKAAYRAQMEVHHPDRGGDPDTAKRINAAFDELQGAGADANTYVAANYNGEPWVVLGISSAADPRLVERAGRQLASELTANARLAARVGWAVDNFAKAVAAPSDGRRRAPITPPPPPKRRPGYTRRPASSEPVPSKPGPPHGLVPVIDFGTVRWGDTTSRTIQLTWKHAAPYNVHVDVESPVAASVTTSKVLPGRFSLTFSIDWNAAIFREKPTTRGYTLHTPVTIRWTSTEWTTIMARGVILYPAYVTASPEELDLGTVKLRQAVRTSIAVVSTAPAELTIAPTPWLQRVDGAGRVLDTPLKLATNTPVRIDLRVHWQPIEERGAKSIAAGRPIRATGHISLSWDGHTTEIPVAMVATTR